MYFFRRHQADYFAEVGVNGVFVEVDMILLAVQEASDRLRFDTSEYASLLEGLASCGGGTAGIVVNTALGKGPAPGAGADQQELDSVFRDAIANGRHVGARGSYASGALDWDKATGGLTIRWDLGGNRHSQLLQQSDTPR